MPNPPFRNPEGTSDTPSASRDSRTGQFTEAKPARRSEPISPRTTKEATSAGSLTILSKHKK